MRDNREIESGNTTRYSCIIFDMDGTISSTNQLIYDSFNHIAERYIHQRLSNEQIVSYFGPPEREAVQNMIGDENIETAMKEYYDFYDSEHHRLASLYDGVNDILQYLRHREVKLGLFTGKGRITTDCTLRHLEIQKYFPVTITGDDVKNHKPSGEGIRLIMEYFGVDKESVLMVGDSMSDIIAAEEVGVDVASVVWDSYHKAEVLQRNTSRSFHTVPDFFAWIQAHYRS